MGVGLPTEENGRFGAERLSNVEQATIGKYIWKISQKKDVLWIKWVQNIYIRDADWWEYQLPRSASWGWQMICKMKDVFKQGYSHNQWLGGSKGYTVKDGYYN